MRLTGFVALSLWLPGLVVSGVPFPLANAIVAWLCWLPNLLVGETAFNKPHARVAEPTPTSV